MFTVKGKFLILDLLKLRFSKWYKTPLNTVFNSNSFQDLFLPFASAFLTLEFLAVCQYFPDTAFLTLSILASAFLTLEKNKAKTCFCVCL